MTTAEQLAKLAAKECAAEWFPVWREDLVDAIALMDTRGRRVGGASIMLWENEWDQLRQTLLSVADSIQEQQEAIE